MNTWLRIALLLPALCLTLALASCGGGGRSSTPVTINNPVPAISSLTPSSASAGGAAFTLTVNGSNFIAGSVVQWNGSSRTTTFASATQLTASIPATDIVNGGTANVTVLNPAPGGGTANAATFTINNPVPVIAGLSPASATAGGAAFTLTVNGSNFIAGSVVQWNGSSRATNLVSGTQLTVAIPAVDVLAGGTINVTVLNPAPGGGVSTTVVFTINNPAPSIQGLAPASGPAGAGAFTLTVNGSNFISGSVVRWNGSDRTTTFVSNGQLTAAIPASDTASSGTASVTVFNPAPQGGTSNAVTFTIVPAPVISSLLPPSVPAGSAPFTLVVNGSNFAGSFIVRWNGADRTTTFVSSTELRAAISAADVAAQGTASVSVFNPTPGGFSSNATTFTISAANNPVPVVNSVTPSSLTAEVTGVGLAVTGSGFVAGSVARWNGSDRATLVVSSTALFAFPLPSDTAAVGSAQLTIFNPTPNGGISNASNLLVNPLPAGAVGVTDRLSVAGDSSAGDFDSFLPAISADGRFIVFVSNADNLVSGDTLGFGDVFVRDTCRGTAAGCVPTTTRVSVSSAGSQSDGNSYNPRISADGRFVAFESSATNLVSGDTNNRNDVFLRDTCAGAVGCAPSTVRISVDSAGNQAADNSWNPSVSATGRFIAFTSSASNLVANDTNAKSDVFVRDTCFGAGAGCTPQTVRVSVDSSGAQGNDYSSGGSISADGRRVAFESGAVNLVSDDTNTRQDIFVRDTCLGVAGACAPATTRVSVDSNGVQGDLGGPSFLPVLSANGRFVAFTSFATNLVANDTNGGHDVFVRDTCFGAPVGCQPSTVRVSVDSNGVEADAPSGGPATGGASVSPDGRFVAFGSRATNLVMGDTNGTFDIFVRDRCLNAPPGCVVATIRVSVALDGTEGNLASWGPAITADGRFVVFYSSATTLLPGNGTLLNVYLARTGRP